MDHKWLKVFIHASIWFAPVLVPFITYLIVEDREVRSLSIQAVLFHFVTWVLIGISAALSWIIIGIPFLIIFGLIALIAPIMGIIAALNDRPYRYPIVGSWVK